MAQQRKPPLVLDEGTKRLLHWLERYPFQRAEDLVFALAHWEKRTVVYERLARLEQLQLIEAIKPGIAQGKRLFHLSPLGLYVCDQLATDPERRTRWETPDRAHFIKEEREQLGRLLPRVPILLFLQDVINGLVANAATALTRQGHRADLVQWNWLRDYDHAFLAPHDQRFRFRAEGALSFCLRFTPVDQPTPQASEGQWYTLLLLHCPLDEISLLRMRLDRLLRWRESAERTAVYDQMPPVLILATTERQAEWWHQAAIQTANRLRLDRPRGAVAHLPNTPEAWANGWRFSWRRLGTKAHCHLQEVLRPLAVPAVPELEATPQGVRPGAPRHARIDMPARHLRGYAFGSEQTTATRTWQQEYRLASLRLTPRHWQILRLFYAHPFLSADNLAHLLALSPTTIKLLAAELVQAGYLMRVVTEVDTRWQVAAPGLHLLAQLAWCHVHRLVRLPLGPGPLQQRGAPGLLKQIHHTAGVYGFFAQLSAALAPLPHVQLRWWETGVISERHFSYHEKIYRFRPDALAMVQISERPFRFWLEWDRGTMVPSDLHTKFKTYAMYLISREWAASSPYLPALLCVAPEIGQERRLTEAAQHCLKQVPASFHVYTATVSHLAREGILAPIWQPVVLPTQGAPPGVRRTALFAKGAPE